MEGFPSVIIKNGEIFSGDIVLPGGMILEIRRLACEAVKTAGGTIKGRSLDEQPPVSEQLSLTAESKALIKKLLDDPEGDGTVEVSVNPLFDRIEGTEKGYLLYATGRPVIAVAKGYAFVGTVDKVTTRITAI